MSIKMFNQTFDFTTLLTRPGYFRMGFLAISVLAVGVTGTAVNKSWYKPLKKEVNCPISSCPSDWLVDTSLAIIIFSWLFGLVIIVAMVSPIHTNWIRTFSFVNSFGYPIFGFFLVVSFVFIVTYLIQVALFDLCGSANDFVPTGFAIYIPCKDIKSLVFQSDLFAVGAIIALAAGILGIYQFWDTKNYESSRVSSSNQTNTTTV